MGKHTEEYCDLCGQLFYHSTSSFVVKGSRKWWWHGEARLEEYEICSSCADVIEYLVSKRTALVKEVRSKLHGKSPAHQMDNKPKPLSIRTAINLIRRKS